MNALRYRARYYWRRFCTSLGFCPDCGTRVNYTTAGRAHCGACGRMK